MKLSLILFFIAGAAATEDGSVAAEQAGSLRRALIKGGIPGGPPAWSCEMRNVGHWPTCDILGGKGYDDTCTPCCECECGALPKRKCVKDTDFDGCVPPDAGGNCDTACACR